MPCCWSCCRALAASCRCSSSRDQTFAVGASAFGLPPSCPPSFLAKCGKSLRVHSWMVLWGFPHDGGDGLVEGQAVACRCLAAALKLLDAVKDRHGDGEVPKDC